MSASSSDDGAFVAGLVAGVIIAIISTLIACGILSTEWKMEAVAKGKAEYVMDPKNGTTTWRWKE